MDDLLGLKTQSPGNIIWGQTNDISGALFSQGHEKRSMEDGTQERGSLLCTLSSD